MPPGHRCGPGHPGGRALAHRPDLLDGVGLIVGIDGFMSEARAVTNFTGNAVATVLVATWTKELDRDKLSAALSGSDPFDEDTMLDPQDLEEPGEALQEPATMAGRAARRRGRGVEHGARLAGLTRRPPL